MLRTKLNSNSQIILKSKNINATNTKKNPNNQIINLNSKTTTINQIKSEVKNVVATPQINSEIIPTFHKNLLKKTNSLNLINNKNINLINNKEENFSIIKSLNDDDPFNIKLKQMATRLIQQKKNKIKQDIKKKIMKLKFTKQLKLRKHLKQLYKFKSHIGLNKNFVYKFNHNHYANKCLKNTYNLFKHLFLTYNYIISKPIFKFTPEKLVILLCYYNSSQNTKKNKSARAVSQINKKNLKNNLFKSCLKLSKILKFSVVLEFVKLQQLNLEGQILAQSIAIKTDKLHKNFRMIANKIVNRANIINPDKINYITNILSGNKQISNMTGITVKKAGRLSREALIPKKTVTIVQRGSLNRIHSDFLTKARYTAKNRRGIYSYTITIGHKCY